MPLTVKLFANLRTSRFDKEIFQITQGITIRDILERLEISEDAAAILFVDGRHNEIDYTLSDGDTLSIFPPVGGG